MFLSKLSGTERRAVWCAWLGWAGAGLDAYLWVLLALPMVRSVLPPGTPDDLIAKKAAIIQSTFLFGWAIGGAIFGRFSDRFGRRKSLAIVILTYSLFTAITGASTQWWHLAIFRFLAALGIGGEWAAGCALVYETLRPEIRKRTGPVVQSGYAVGSSLASGCALLFTDTAPSWLFTIGLLPAFVVPWILRTIPETSAWRREIESKRTVPSIRALLSGRLGATTGIVLLVTSLALTTGWAFLFFMPQLVRARNAASLSTGGGEHQSVELLTLSQHMAMLCGYFVSAWLAARIGYQRAFATLFAIAGACLVTAGTASLSNSSTFLLMIAYSLTGLGMFGILPIYLPALFPTLLRSLGAGICFNSGRVVASIGTLVVPWIASTSDLPASALLYASILCAGGVGAALLLPKVSATSPDDSDKFGGPDPIGPSLRPLPDLQAERLQQVPAAQTS